jgi:hypothetical protein
MLRGSYPVIVVDTEAVPDSSYALELAREADAVLLAVRMGRRGGPADRTTKRLLEECNAKILGVVPTLASSRTLATADVAHRVPAIEVSQVRS